MPGGSGRRGNRRGADPLDNMSEEDLIAMMMGGAGPGPGAGRKNKNRNQKNRNGGHGQDPLAGMSEKELFAMMMGDLGGMPPGFEEEDEDMYGFST
jgi:hypothetical protein